MMSAERFTVLVVNDETLLHRILHASLPSSGFVVEKARTAEEPLAVVRERTVEVAWIQLESIQNSLARATAPQGDNAFSSRVKQSLGDGYRQSDDRR